MSKLKLKYLC